MKKKKGIILAVVFLAVVILANMLLNFCLVQPGLGRTILHDAEAGDYETVIIGASHGSYGLDTNVISRELEQKTMNLCMGGEYMRDAYHVLQHAVKYNDVKNVVLDIDYQYLVNYHKESILFNAVYNAFPNNLDKFSYYKDKVMSEDYRGTFLRWTNFWQCYKKIPRTIEKKFSVAYKEYSPSVVSMNPYDKYMGNGFINRSKDAKKDATGAVCWDVNKVSASEVGYIKKIADYCKKHNINLTFTTIAVDPDTVAADVNNYQASHDYIANIANELGICYYDFNYCTFEKFDRSTEDYWDKEGHMYGDTADRFSRLYASVLEQSWNKTLVNSAYFDTDLNQLYQNR